LKGPLGPFLSEPVPYRLATRFRNDPHDVAQIFRTVRFDVFLLRPSNVVRPEQSFHDDRKFHPRTRVGRKQLLADRYVFLQNWMGAYVGEQKKEIQEYFGIRLPGLRELPRGEAGDELGV